MKFIDTNVLLYLVSTAPEEARKAEKAAEILEERDLALSVQVLQEFYVQATRTDRRAGAPLLHEQAGQLIEAFLRFRVEPMTVEVVRGALAMRARYGVSFWDGCILEAARVSGCDTVLSEDLSHGQIYGTVRVVNPFAD